MRGRRWAPVVLVALAAGLSGCGGGGDGGGSGLAIGQEAVVQHAETGSGEAGKPTTLAVTVLAVRPGTQQELEDGGFTLDPEEKELAPYYVDVRYENRGDEPLERHLGVSMEDQDGNLITQTTIISLGGPPFAKCARAEDGTLEPGQSYESCALFLVPEGSEPTQVRFLPYVPGTETDWVRWDIA